MARKRGSKRLGTSGLHRPGIMNAPGSPGQDGFNLPSHTTAYAEGNRTEQVGRDSATASDSRGRGGYQGQDR